VFHVGGYVEAQPSQKGEESIGVETRVSVERHRWGSQWREDSLERGPEGHDLFI